MQLLSVEQGSMNISASDHDPLKSLALDYMNLFSHGSAFSDVVFCVEGKQVHAHRCILAARSSFFRMIFCKGDQSGSELGSPISANLPLQIPVEIVGYDVFVILLQFLYSGQLILAFQQGRSRCLQRGCWHAHCSSSVDLALDTLHAANFFGVDQLSTLIQRHLGAVVEKISIDDVMRVLVAAKKQGLHPLWETCSELVAKSGLTVDALRKHLPRDIAAEIEEMRVVQRGYGCMHHSSPSADRSSAHLLQQRIRKMRQALDSLDVELVRLMVMGEGLDLDSALALHYSVNNCSRDVVKALLEMGAVNVNHPDAAGRTALHVACEMASPDMISVLLDHHASPLLQSDGGDAPLDIIQALISRAESGSPSNAVDHNKLCLCLELLQSAAYVADKEEEDLSDGVVTEPSSDNTNRSGLHVNQPSNPMDIPDCSSAFEPINPRSGLNPDWASIESSCSFEQEPPNHSHHQHNNQISFLHNDSIVRMASPPSSGGLNTMISSNLDGFLYPDFRMAMLGAAGSCNPSSTTIF